MARQKEPEPDRTGKVPLWFMTYSDVITLLMTFFILLLTFATAEPEKFERMQISAFGPTGGTGIATPGNDDVEQDSLVVRYRPGSGRMSMQGSEIAPMDSETVTKSLNKGLQAIDQEKERPISVGYKVRTDLGLMVTSDRQVTPMGQHRMHQLARQLRKRTHTLRLQVYRPQDVDRALALAFNLVEDEEILPGHIAVAFIEDPSLVATTSPLDIVFVAEP